MAVNINVPLLPESVNDATVAAWNKKVGDLVQEGDILVELETDKVMLEVPAVQSGVLSEIQEDVGSVVMPEQLLGVIVEADEKPLLEKPAQVTNQRAGLQGDLPKSPSVRKSMHALSLSDEDIQGSGKHGRILADDLEISSSESENSPSPDSIATKGEVLSVPMSRMRLKIAERLLQSQQTTASLSTFNEIDLSAVMSLRKRYKDTFIKKHDIKLGLMSFFVKACCIALQEFPEVNASVDGNNILFHHYCDVGIAVSSDKGLLVPILRDAQEMSMYDIEKNIVRLADKARNGKLSLDEMAGGTFTITNGGVFGSMLSTPILNIPQSAILGMHNIVERPVVVKGEIVIRPMMYVALTYDHRIIDGSKSVGFLVMVKSLLEDPSRILLDV